MSSYYIYRHIRPDKNEVFYIGIGKENSNRHNSKRRNAIWKNIVAKNNGNFQAEIMLDNLTLEDANAKEKEFIELYGRIKYKTGTLSNILYGGKGNEDYLYKMSNEQKLKIASFHKGNKYSLGHKHTKEFREKMSLIQKGKPGCNTGKKLTKEQREKLRLASIGNKSNTGKFSVTNGYRNIFLDIGEEIPIGFEKGMTKHIPMSEETKEKMSKSRKGKPLKLSPEEIERRKNFCKNNTYRNGNKSGTDYQWITNGIETKRIFKTEPIPENWKKGRTLLNKNK